MPYKSEKQRRWMHANKPELAAKWDRKYGSAIKERAIKQRIKRKRR